MIILCACVAAIDELVVSTQVVAKAIVVGDAPLLVVSFQAVAETVVVGDAPLLVMDKDEVGASSPAGHHLCT